MLHATSDSALGRIVEQLAIQWSPRRAENMQFTTYDRDDDAMDVVDADLHTPCVIRAIWPLLLKFSCPKHVETLFY